MKYKVREVMGKRGLAAFVLIGLLALFLVGYNAGRGEVRDPSAMNGTEPCAVEGGILKDLIARSAGVEGLSYRVVTQYPMWSHEARVWVQGDLIRTETVVDGEPLVLVVNGSTGELLSYDGAENAVTRISLGEGYAGTESPLDFVQDLDPGEWVQGEAAFFDGLRCRQFIREGAGEQMVMYVWEEFGLPLRVEVTVDGRTTVTEFRDIEVGPQPADIFDLPAGAPVLDLLEEDAPAR